MGRFSAVPVFNRRLVVESEPASFDHRSTTTARTRRGGEGDGGQAAPFTVILLLLAGGVMLVLAPLGRATLDRAEARTAADAAVLAGAANGPAAARALAEANGGQVVDLTEGERGLTVAVLVGDALATARAERAEPASSGGEGRTGLAPAMLAAIARAEQLLGRPITIVSGFRTRAEQQRLWDERASNPYPVAPPGTSRHESGFAIDVPSAVVPDLRRIGPTAGLCSPLPVSDPIHFELCRWSPN